MAETAPVTGHRDKVTGSPYHFPVRHLTYLLLVAFFCSWLALGADPEEGEPLAHPTFRAGISGGYGDFGAIGGIEFRAMLHDLMDTGHNSKHYGIGEVGNVRLSWQSNPSKVRFDEITLLHLGGFVPRDSDEEKEWSYFLKLSSTTIRDSSCGLCLSGNIEGGWGATLGFGDNSPFLLFGLISADLSLAAGFTDFVRVGAGPHVGFRLFPLRNLVLMAEGYYRYRIGGYKHGHYGRTELRWNFSKTLALWIRGERFPDGWEAKLGTFFYF